MSEIRPIAFPKHDTYLASSPSVSTHAGIPTRRHLWFFGFRVYSALFSQRHLQRCRRLFWLLTRIPANSLARTNRSPRRGVRAAPLAASLTKDRSCRRSRRDNFNHGKGSVQSFAVQQGATSPVAMNPNKAQRNRSTAIREKRRPKRPSHPEERA